MPKPRVIQEIEAQRARLQAHEAVVMREMADRWLGVENALKADMLDLAFYLDELRAKGETITTARLMQMDRYKAMIADARREQEQYSLWLADTLAQDQRSLVQQGITDAQRLIEAAGIDAKLASVMFDRINVGAVDFLAGFASDGTPLYDLLRASYPESIVKLTDALIQGLATGKGPRATAAMMAENMAGNLDRALMIARTEQLRALRAGNLTQMGGSNVVDGYIRRAQRSSNVCAACFVAGTLVSGLLPEKVFSRHYTGDIVIIETASGKNLTVTPNHPILTDAGWINAGDLRVGNNVIRYTGGDGAFAGIGINDYQAPIPIEKIVEKLGMIPAEMECSAPYFHGDGAGSNVYTVWTNSLLGNNGKSTFSKQVGENDFGLGSTRPFSALRHFLKGLRKLYTSFHRPLFATTGSAQGVFPGGEGYFGGSERRGFGNSAYSSSAHSDAGGNGLPGNVVSVGQFPFSFSGPISGSNFNIGEVHLSMLSSPVLQTDSRISIGFGSENSAGFEDVDKTGVINMEDGRDLLDTLAGQISEDRILNISVRRFSGHVYNLQTKTGWYIANDIISHNCLALDGTEVDSLDPETFASHPNCACYAQPKLKYGKTPSFQSGPDWLDDQPESVKLQILGKGRFDLYQAGQLDWSNVAKIHNDPVWGKTIAQGTLAEVGG